MANGIEQISSVLRKVISQATGRGDISALDTAQLLTIGEQCKANSAALGMMDPVLQQISQMAVSTVFSARPYKRKFAALKADPFRWGNVTRKLKIMDKESDLKDNEYIPLTEGESVDQYKVDKTDVLQLNFAGQKTYEIAKTIYDTQYDVCFHSAEEFARFLSLIMTYVANKIEKIHEETARTTVAGCIAGRVAEKKVVTTSNSVVYLITEYNNATGATLTNKTVYAPENFKDFMEWAFAYISDLSEMMTEYTVEYQTSLTGGKFDQHTPKREQVAFFYTPLINQCTTRVLTNQFNSELMTLPGFEKVNFWQSAKPGERDKIHVTNAKYLAADGTAKDGGEVNVANVFGLLADRDAMVYSPVLTRVKQSPYNAAGEYRNIFWKFNERHAIDFTEKSIVLLMDTDPAA